MKRDLIEQVRHDNHILDEILTQIDTWVEDKSPPDVLKKRVVHAAMYALDRWGLDTGANKQIPIGYLADFFIAMWWREAGGPENDEAQTEAAS